MRRGELPLLPRFVPGLRRRAGGELEQQSGAPLDFNFIAGDEIVGLFAESLLRGGVQKELPRDALLAGKDELKRLVMCVDQEQESGIADRVTFEGLHVNCVTAQKHAEAADERRIPFL